MAVKNVMVVYGGVSPEHEVAIVTALQVMNALRKANFTVAPVYIGKQGNWFLGGEEYFKPETYKDLLRTERLGKRVILSPDRNYGLLTKGFLGFGPARTQPDVIFPVIHGKSGEDGTLQGLFELANLPYVGCGVTASAVKIDKYLAKKIAAGLGIKVLADQLVVRGEKTKLSKMTYPLFVKPVGLGSSIGLTRVEDENGLADALEVAFCYDDRAMLEEAIEEPEEVNISVIGNNPYQLSVTEQPLASGEILSFADKYTSAGGKSQGMASARRYIPAKVDAKIIKQVEAGALKFFRAIGGKGIARVDFMVDKKGAVYFNEINTLPGSLAYYLWEKSGLSFPKLVTKLVELALADFTQKQELITTFESNILAGFVSRGLKGNKGR